MCVSRMTITSANLYFYGPVRAVVRGSQALKEDPIQWCQCSIDCAACMRAASVSSLRLATGNSSNIQAKPSRATHRFQVLQEVIYYLPPFTLEPTFLPCVDRCSCAQGRDVTGYLPRTSWSILLHPQEVCHHAFYSPPEASSELQRMKAVLQQPVPGR